MLPLLLQHRNRGEEGMREIEVWAGHKEGWLEIHIGDYEQTHYGAMGILLTKEEAKDLIEKIKKKLKEKKE